MLYLLSSRSYGLSRRSWRIESKNYSYVVIFGELDPKRIHDLVCLYDVRAALAADGAKLVIHAMDVFDTKLLATHATTRRLFAAASPWAGARGRGNYAARSH